MNNNIDPESRFIMSPQDISIQDKKGNLLKGKEMIEYLKKEREKTPIIFDKLEIGEKVLTQNDENIYTISDFNIAGFDYAGSKDNEEDNLFLFNQNDITTIISKNNSHKK